MGVSLRTKNVSLAAWAPWAASTCCSNKGAGTDVPAKASDQSLGWSFGQGLAVRALLPFKASSMRLAA
jgi:hypothetical protein